ncbi:MAG TPA: 3'-5' exonuclease, partial [Anaeromyxobacteraceae bacterium]|nr:3'-5' exonuclease [Anaeromyxobacteraceae bacterium]
PPEAAAADADGARRERRAVEDAARAFLSARAQGASAAGRIALESAGRAWSALRPDDLAGPLTPGALARFAALGAAVRGRRLVKGDGELKPLGEALAAAVEGFLPAAAEALGWAQRTEWCALVADAQARYEAAKRTSDTVDFDDLLLQARDLLRRDGAVRAELRGRCRAFLVDEYQDVNGVQQEIFDLVAGPGEPPGPVLVAVGDLKQSIYRFRGADVTVFARLVRRLEAGEGRVLHLQQNHRSAPAVLDLVNETFARAMPQAHGERRDDEIAFGPSDRLLATRTGGPAAACELLDDAEGGTSADRRAREARAVAGRIRALVSGAAGVAVRARGDGGVERERTPRFGDLAVLFRRLTQVGEYERALREAGIPYRLARGGGFYQASEVRDLGELIATLFDPDDVAAWAAVLRSPLCGVSDGALLLLARVGLGRIARLGEAELAGEVQRVAGRGAGGPAPIEDGAWRRLQRFLAVWRELRDARHRLAAPDLLARAAGALDLDAALLAGPDGDRRAVNVEKAIALARRFAAGGGSAPGFAAHLRALASRPPREPEAEPEAGDAVALLSVHQAKGLEWPIVFVPDLGARPRPDGRRAMLDGSGRLCAAWYDAVRDEFVETLSLRAARDEERRAASAESRRLLYVALTRARDALVLSGEAARGSDSWRALVEAAAAARPELVRRIPIEGASPPAGAPVVRAEDGGEERAARFAARLAPPAPPAPVRTAVTDLAEWARCPRRHHLGRRLGIPEPRGEGGGPADDDPARATARGTLAHAMLAESDLGAPPLARRLLLAAAAARRGYDPEGETVRRIRGEVERFAASEGGRALAAAAAEGRLAREVPFLLRLDGSHGAPACYLSGAIDALATPPRGGGAVTVIDYKYALPRAGSAERYRFQLLAYALAASRAYPGVRVRARLQFLRGDHRSVDLTPAPEELARFAAEAPRLAWDAHRGAGDLPPAALGRDEARCRAEGCGYAARCYPRSRGAAAGEPPGGPGASGGDAPPRAAADMHRG